MPPYSTLEVREAETYQPYDSDGIQKEAIPHPDSFHPQLVAFENDISGTHLPEVVNYEKEQPLGDPPVFHEQQPGSRTCGLPKRIFRIFLTVGLVVIIGAIAGGVAGGLASKQHYTSKKTDGSSTHPNVNVLNISRLASSNRTDANGNTHRIVFFQDPNNAIIARRWDSQNTTWVTANLTDIMKDTSSPFNLPPGAPMAAASCKYNNVIETHLFFPGPDNIVGSLQLMSPDAAPDGWEYGTIGDAALATFPGSQIAAAWQRCWRRGCVGNWVVAYQTPQGDINVANATNWANPTTVIEERSVADRSSLALMPEIQGSGLQRVILISESLGSGEVGTMQKITYVDSWNPSMNLYPSPNMSFKSHDDLIEALPPPGPNVQFAMTVRNNFTVTNTLSLLPNGTVTALWWGGHFQSIPAINFRSGPDVNFTAISAGEDVMIYGISNDEILQYEPDKSNISNYVYVGRVYP
ncbi:hypothetical protein F4804DRAFT_331851 [Jackrogersella minutella]|nr:hypothetical protein F4804DRAFT_331851 [Jackrogersella minutella]